MWLNSSSQYRLVHLCAMLKELLDDLMTKSGNQYNGNVRLTDVVAEDILNKLQRIIGNDLVEYYLLLIA
jgi:hypothetical protein